MNTLVVSAFPASGKSYACKLLQTYGYKVLDSDSSLFSWTQRHYTEEELKKIRERDRKSPKFTTLLSGKNYVDLIKDELITARHPDFPHNYIEHIKDNLGKVDIIFVSSHREVRQALENNKIDYVMVVPDKELKAELIGRCYLRDNKNGLFVLIANKFDEWLNEINTEKHKHCRLKLILNRDTPYLFDVLDKYGII